MLNKTGARSCAGRGAPPRPLGAFRHVTAEPAAHAREFRSPVSR
ncbi:hypothetical protein ABTX60_34070 [Streptomyces sp. NPDC126510]